MNANQLGRILRRIATATLPFGNAGEASALRAFAAAATCATSLTGCLFCGGDPVIERRVITVPDGWEVEDEGLRDPDGVVYYDGSDDPTLCYQFCSSDVHTCYLIYCGRGSSEDGCSSSSLFAVECSATVEESCGRRPAGLLPRARRHATGASARDRRRRPSPLAGFLASSAHLEAASVDAFEILRRELTAHRAPLRLRRAASASARDERRHARVMAALARRARGATERARVLAPGDGARRTILAIALENAREGVVFETYGALVALWQADHAADQRLRAAYRRIARDELRHAALAFRVAEWADGLLSESERTEVAAERRQAAADLAAAATNERAPEVVTRAGVPNAAAARVLVQRLNEALAFTR